MEVVQVLLVLALGMPTLGPLAPAVRKSGHMEKYAGRMAPGHGSADSKHCPGGDHSGVFPL